MTPKNSRSAPLLAITVFLLFVLGIVMVFNASSADALETGYFDKTHRALIRQIVNFLVSFIICTGFWHIGYKELLKSSPLLLLFIIIALIAVFIPGIGRCVNGSHRWIVIGNFVGQPSEFVKIILPLYYIHKIVGEDIDAKERIKVMLTLCLPVFLVLIEPSNGVTAVLGATFTVLLFLSRIPYKWWLFPVLACFSVAAFAAYKIPYVQARIESYLHPERDLLGKGHQPFQAKIAAGSGGIFGRGFGQSLQKLNYLPEAQNDYIAAIYAEETGYIGILIIILLYMFMGFLGFSIALRARRTKAALLACSITFSLCLQAFLNLAVVSGLLPSTGLNLPFFSQGGSSLLANMLVITILLDIERSEKGVEKRTCLIG